MLAPEPVQKRILCACGASIILRDRCEYLPDRLRYLTSAQSLDDAGNERVQCRCGRSTRPDRVAFLLQLARIGRTVTLPSC